MMEENTDQKRLKDTFTIGLLLSLIIVRFLPMGEDNDFIKSIGYIGVLIALLDLYVDADRLYGDIDKFKVLKGACFLLISPLALLLGFLATGAIPINAAWSDVFTLLALLVSLPESLYLTWIGKYVRKGKV